MKPYWQRDPTRYSKCAFSGCNRTALASTDICEFHERIGRMEHYGTYKGDKLTFKKRNR